MDTFFSFTMFYASCHQWKIQEFIEILNIPFIGNKFLADVRVFETPPHILGKVPSKYTKCFGVGLYIPVLALWTR
jgi:hypothetical protein